LVLKHGGYFGGKGRTGNDRQARCRTGDGAGLLDLLGP